MSKVSEAKACQHYCDNPVQPVCSTCKHYTSRIETYETRYGGTRTEEKDRRCGLGGFVVKKTATCMHWEVAP